MARRDASGHGSRHPTEEVLAEMRQADPPIPYLVGKLRGGFSKLERPCSICLGKPCARVSMSNSSRRSSTC